MINLGTILKPLMLMQGINNFQIHFNASRKIVEISGVKIGVPFKTEQTFTELEAAINGETAANPAGSTANNNIDDPGQS